MFLDRDGTINVKAPDGQYITSAAQLRLLPGAGRAIRRFNDQQLLVVVVSNQRGVARGVMTLDDLAAVNERLVDLLLEQHAHVDGIYTCVHEQGRCDCRKPGPGLLLQAQRDHPEIELASSVMVGDSESDVLAGRAAGTATIRLGPPDTQTCSEALCPDLSAAADLIGSWARGASPISRPT